ncbi:Tn3 family transposase [Streptomyces sp. NPDC002659]|uniref:Tn3 family transposase n=1 Tax=Streptomyces sp. NPDC002659 TaxID=3364656 RepID=UPI00367A00C1
MLEVHSWTPYLSDFTHVSAADSRAKDLALSVAAVLTSEATNVGVAPIVHEGNEALSRDRLFWVEQNYLPLRPCCGPMLAWSTTTPACHWYRRGAAVSLPPPTDCGSSPRSAP